MLKPLLANKFKLPLKNDMITVNPYFNIVILSNPIPKAIVATITSQSSFDQ